MPAAQLNTLTRRAAPVFSALGDGVRLHILARLCEGEPLSITRLTEGVKITRQAVTKHLHVLEKARLVRGSRTGREQIWELKPEPLTARFGAAYGSAAADELATLLDNCPP